MNQKNTVGCVAMLLILMSRGYAVDSNQVCEKKSGTVRCQSGEVDTIRGVGLVYVNQTSVKKRLEAKGRVFIQSAQINEMKVYGEVVLVDTAVFGAASVYGHVNSQQSQFNQALVVYGNTMHALGSGFKDIIVESDIKNPHVVLAGQSVVSGSVIFKGEYGTVELLGGAKVMGKIINGKNQ